MLHQIPFEATFHNLPRYDDHRNFCLTMGTSKKWTPMNHLCTNLYTTPHNKVLRALRADTAPFTVLGRHTAAHLVPLKPTTTQQINTLYTNRVMCWQLVVLVWRSQNTGFHFSAFCLFRFTVTSFESFQNFSGQLLELERGFPSHYANVYFQSWNFDSSSRFWASRKMAGLQPTLV